MNKLVAIVAAEGHAQIAELVVPVLNKIGEFDYLTSFASPSTRAELAGRPIFVNDFVKDADAIVLSAGEGKPDDPEAAVATRQLQKMLKAHVTVQPAAAFETAADRRTDPQLVPSASLNEKGQGIYRPARSEAMLSSPAVALCLAMALRHSLDMPEAAIGLENAVAQTLEHSGNVNVSNILTALEAL